MSSTLAFVFHSPSASFRSVANTSKTPCRLSSSSSLLTSLSVSSRYSTWISNSSSFHSTVIPIRSNSMIRPRRRLRPRQRHHSVVSSAIDTDTEKPGDDEKDPRGINGTTLFYAALVVAQLLPFSDKTNGVIGDLIYFSVTALSCIVIGVRRAPLEPPTLSTPISTKQAIAAPFTASIFLFGSYLLLKYTTVNINLFLNGLTTIAGAVCVKETLDPILFSLFKSLGIPNKDIISSKTDDNDNELQPSFSTSNLTSTLISVGMIVAYLLKFPPTFVFSNAIAVALATRVLSLIRPSSYLVGTGLLIGLFFYDIFWVFGSEVMVSVATNIDTPGKLLFPRPNSTDYPYAILGLGDICVPGIFISIAQSLDFKLIKNPKQQGQPYFVAAVSAYVIALFACFFVNFQTSAAQPALLYLVPALIGSTLAVGAVRGEVKEVISYSANEEENEKEEEERLKKSS